ncbi:MAG: hypothetical protein R2822_08670 [Spirosomataceae bacterium]
MGDNIILSTNYLNASKNYVEYSDNEIDDEIEANDDEIDDEIALLADRQRAGIIEEDDEESLTEENNID